MAHAWSRQLFGSTNYNPPSRFIDEIPPELIDQIGAVSGRTTYGRQSYRVRDEWADPPPYRRVDRDDNGDAERHRERVVEAALVAERTRRVRHGRHLNFTGTSPGGGPSGTLRHRFVVAGERSRVESDDKAEATIRFRDAGTKHLSLAWAPLKKL